jgi:mRNA interferase MazF
MQQIKVNKSNGLSKKSAVDCFQVKNFSNERLVEKIGSIDDTLLKSIHQTIAKSLNPNYKLDIS